MQRIHASPKRMEMAAAESTLIKKPKLRWLEREKESGRIYDWATVASGVILAGTLTLSYWMLSREATPARCCPRRRLRCC